MNDSEVTRFNRLYERHLELLKLQGMSPCTIDLYPRAVRRIRNHFDCCPDQLTKEQMEGYFSQLVDSHSWSTVRVDRNGLQFFWRYVLGKDWEWINIVKPPKVKTIPDILTVSEVERITGPDVAGPAGALAEASPSFAVVSELQGLFRNHSIGHQPHGQRRLPESHEGGRGRMRH